MSGLNEHKRTQTNTNEHKRTQTKKKVCVYMCVWWSRRVSERESWGLDTTCFLTTEKYLEEEEEEGGG
jgi:hypothetical protein